MSKPLTWGTFYVGPSIQLVLNKWQYGTEELQSLLQPLQPGHSTFYANLNTKGSRAAPKLDGK